MEYLFTLLIPTIAAVVVVLAAKRVASHTFKCKHCSGEFRIKWFKVIFTEHSGDEYRTVCPCCKTEGWCTQQPKNKR